MRNYTYVLEINKIKRLTGLAEKVFAVKNDPDQLDVNEEVIRRLIRIHPMTVSEFRVEDGPVAWVLIIPTTKDLMDQFIDKRINERELFEMTPEGVKYETVYLCSALVLEEYRQKGITRELAIKAFTSIMKDHPLKYLFVWPFSPEGDIAATKIAEELELPLYKRKS